MEQRLSPTTLRDHLTRWLAVVVRRVWRHGLRHTAALAQPGEEDGDFCIAKAPTPQRTERGVCGQGFSRVWENGISVDPNHLLFVVSL